MATTLEARETTHIFSLSESVSQVLKRLFGELKGNEIVDLYQLIIEQIEPTLFEMVMEYSRYNQSKAAYMLGMSRGTLRSRLRKCFGDKYVGTRNDREKD